MLESGMNDGVLLPIVVLSMLFLRSGEPPPAPEIGRRLVGLFLLGPGAGVLVGLLAISALDEMRRRFEVRRDYESLYALGVAFTAYSAAELVDGSGFLAAFAAGLVIASLDVEICDCFLNYGEATAEMFLLLTFVAFGTSPIWQGLTVIDGSTLLFVAIALAVRTAVLLPILRQFGVDRDSRRLIAWLGPRGLSSLLLVLLPVFAGLPGSERLFTISSLVVLLSVVLHGGGIAVFVRKREAAMRARQPSTPAPPLTAASDSRLAPAADAIPERITLDELRELWRRNEPVVLLDVRTERSFATDPVLARGAVRLPPEEAVPRVTQLNPPRSATLVAYCA
jgi:NhaP-type Na+/H+ or K+/H+ antiporter